MFLSPAAHKPQKQTIARRTTVMGLGFRRCWANKPKLSSDFKDGA